MFGRATIRLGIGPHSSLRYFGPFGQGMMGSGFITVADSVNSFLCDQLCLVYRRNTIK